ncbi:DUF1990 domain-containing protein [Rhodococcus spelaei]|uniref:DUF1990 domain-containing protein n=1 Tax=Rhodococcus spelaei TaxID=2546320 RepID=A0A541BA25_9NOCA|nr:DUF1990 domain-containing protein [Rhodococcus spelaei]TQF69185.1 DUF1990 domain-containing protein [Rhodococcus spelaei]
MNDRPLQLTYAEIGATATELPAGYHHVRRDCVIGRGEAAFRDATERLMRWDMHRRAGIGVSATTPRAETGARVTLRLGAGPVHLTAHCEVVYVVDEARRRGFAYGTLTGHPERGEERFCVVWHDDDTVTLAITAFSRPATWWSRAGSPIARIVQRRITDRYLRALQPRADGYV